MDDFLDAHTEQTDDLQEQKKIVIKHRKIKRATRTFLYNIDHWLEPDDIKVVAKKVKRKLGTSSQVITDDEGTALTFNGDHTQEIRQLMLDACDQLSAKSFA
jgi:translation initiation factor 1 (eIF-1/SUI1)